MWRKPLDVGTVETPRGEVQVDASWCKGCAYCVEFCPTDVLIMSGDFNGKGYHFPLVDVPDACVDCKLCELLCPEYAVVVLTVHERSRARVVAITGQANETPAPPLPATGTTK